MSVYERQLARSFDAGSESSLQRQPYRAALAAFVGTTVEWYDFYIYATAAALVFGQVFFPSENPFASTMASFASFAVGFFARPLGAIVFGHVGDKLGRKRALIATLFLMGSATVCIGLLPGYDSIGMLAPIGLVALRILQGIAVGGEWGGAVLIAREHAPSGRETFFASFAQLGSPAGLILSLLAFRAIVQMEPGEFLRWGWRLPFLASAVLLVLGAMLRLGLHETPEFQREKTAQRDGPSPLQRVLLHDPTKLLLAIAANTIGIGAVYVTNTFMMTYTTSDLGVAKSVILDSLLIVACVQLAAQLLAARVAQRMGTQRFMVATLIGAMLSSVPMFVLVGRGEMLFITLGISIATVCVASYYAVIAGYVSGLFSVDVRYTAISLAYQLCGALAGGLTPLICTWLANSWAGHWWPLAAFFSTLALISLVAIALLMRREARWQGLERTDVPLGRKA